MLHENQAREKVPSIHSSYRRQGYFPVSQRVSILTLAPDKAIITSGNRIDPSAVVPFRSHAL